MADLNNIEHKSTRPVVITICSGKGGVGKSILAANLAYAISKRNKTVLLWDANINFPNQHLLLGVEPPVRLSDVYSGRVKIENAYFQFSPTLFLLADIPGGSALSQVNQDVSEVIDPLLNNNRFDYIIIDTPAAISPEILQYCQISDIINIVITDEPTSLLDAYGLLKILLQYFDPEKMKLLVNNVIDGEDADEITHKLNLATEKFLKIHLEVFGIIPYDRAVRQSIMQQELFMITNPLSDVAKAVDKAADSIILNFI